MPYCSFGNCKRNTEKCNPSEKIYFFPFPRDEKLRQVWLSKCRREETEMFDVENVYVCSVHFNKNDFDRDWQHELLKLPLRLLLKKDAVPSENPSSNSEWCESTKNEDERKSVFIEENEDTLSIKSEKDSDSESIGNLEIADIASLELEAVSAIKYEADLKIELEPDQSPSITEDEPDLSFINDEHQKLVKQHFALEELLVIRRMQVKKIKAQINLQKEKVSRLKTLSKKLQARIHVLRKHLSPAQMNALFGETKLVWGEDDKIKANKLNSINPRCFYYITDQLKYPLPIPITNTDAEEYQNQPLVPRSSKNV